MQPSTRWDCGPEAGKKISQLSKGYKQRVGLAAALIHSPEVLILDEPTTGLDPNQIVEIRDVIKNYGKNRTVLFSSHILQEVEAICDRVIIIHQGKIIADNNLGELRQEQNGKFIKVVLKETYCCRSMCRDLISSGESAKRVILNGSSKRKILNY